MTGDRSRQQLLLFWEHLIAAQLSPQKSSANPRTAAWGYVLPRKEARLALCLQGGGLLIHIPPATSPHQPYPMRELIVPPSAPLMVGKGSREVGAGPMQGKNLGEAKTSCLRECSGVGQAL